MPKKNVVIAQGILEPVERDDGYLFKGVPYARAGRFQPPSAPEPWQGVLRADQFAPKCPQSTSEPGSRNKSYNHEFFNYPEFAVEQGEDCLRLNIWTPKQAKGCPGESSMNARRQRRIQAAGI